MFIYHIYVHAYYIIVKMLVALYLQKNVSAQFTEFI
jgi:hypothetical protein